MDISAALLAYLRHLSADPDQATQLADSLTHLSNDIAVWVPSWRSVSIVLAACPHDIDVSVLAPGTDTVVLSSLALRISDRHGGEQLIMRAAQPGAFLLLGDDLSTRLGPHHTITLDHHLTPPSTPHEQAAALTDLSAINQAIGVLLVEGFTPNQVHHERQHRATTAAVSLPVAAHQLLIRPAMQAHAWSSTCRARSAPHDPAQRRKDPRSRSRALPDERS